jgi:anti-sigma regulatory factor (Ser/Thr protein kinase)
VVWERRSFEPRLESVREARRFVREVAAEVGADPGAAELLASELATNAVVHAQSRFEVRVGRNPDALRVEFVNDKPELLPTRNRLSEEGGRGLAIIAALAKDWGTESLPDCKAVWFELPAPRGGRDPTGETQV